MSDLNLALFESIGKEFFCNENGVVTVTKTGQGRLCGVSRQNWGRGGSKVTVKIDRFLMTQGIDPAAIYGESGRFNEIPATKNTRRLC